MKQLTVATGAMICQYFYYRFEVKLCAILQWMDKVRDRVTCAKLCVGDAGLNPLTMDILVCYYDLPGTTSSIQMGTSPTFR